MYPSWGNYGGHQPQNFGGSAPRMSQTGGQVAQTGGFGASSSGSGSGFSSLQEQHLQQMQQLQMLHQKQLQSVLHHNTNVIPSAASAGGSGGYSGSSWQSDGYGYGYTDAGFGDHTFQQDEIQDQPMPGPPGPPQNQPQPPPPPQQPKEAQPKPPPPEPTTLQKTQQNNGVPKPKEVKTGSSAQEEGKSDLSSMSVQVTLHFYNHCCLHVVTYCSFVIAEVKSHLSR